MDFLAKPTEQMEVPVLFCINFIVVLKGYWNILLVLRDRINTIIKFCFHGSSVQIAVGMTFEACTIVDLIKT